MVRSGSLVLAATILLEACSGRPARSAPPTATSLTGPASPLPSSQASLVTQLGNGDANVAAQALESLVAAGRNAVPALKHALTDQEPAVRKRAAEGLGMIGDTSAADALFQAVDDQDGRVRAQAATALARVGDPRAPAALVRTLDDAPDPLHANLTLSGETLISLGPSAVPALAGALQSGSDAAARQAALVLLKIASDHYDDRDGQAWRELHLILEPYRPDATSAQRASIATAARAWVSAHPALTP
jgi:hypothetical protein